MTEGQLPPRTAAQQEKPEGGEEPSGAPGNLRSDPNSAPQQVISSLWASVSSSVNGDFPSTSVGSGLS